MTQNFDQPATMPKMRPTPKSPSSKKAARRARIKREKEHRAVMREGLRRAQKDAGG